MRAHAVGLAVAVLLAAGFAPAEDRGDDRAGDHAGSSVPPAAPCQQTRLAEIALTTEPGGLVAVPVMLDGKPILLAVDTGAVHTVISSRIADALQLERTDAAQTYELVGGVAMTQIAYSHSFSIGALATGRVGLMIAPSSALTIDTDGLFGPDAMKNYDVEIDYAHGRFGLFSQDHCPGQVVYWTHDPYAQIPMHVDDDWHISVPVTLDGHPLTAFIDTGAERSLMTLSTAHTLFGIDKDNPAMKKMENVSVNGTDPTTIYHYPFTQLMLEGIAVQHPDIDIMSDDALGANGPQLVVGAGVLRQLHLYIGYKEQILYATPAEAK